MSPTTLDKWLKKTTPDDTGLTRPPTVSCVSTHKDEVRSIVHGYFQSQFSVSLCKEVGRPPHDSIKREQDLAKVTNAFMTQYTIPIGTNQPPKLPSRTDVEVWWMSNDQEEEKGEEEEKESKETEDLLSTLSLVENVKKIMVVIFIPAFIPIC